MREKLSAAIIVTALFLACWLEEGFSSAWKELRLFWKEVEHE